MKNLSTKQKIELAVLVALECLVCLTPLGSIPAIGPIVATTSAIPVIITALVFGTAYGIFLGFIFGLLSFLVWTFIPPNPAFAFIFTPLYKTGSFNGNVFSIIICFLPRIMIGLNASLMSKTLKNMDKKANFAISSIVGSLTNTILVFLFIALFFGKQYEQIAGNALIYIIMSQVVTSGIPEAIICAIVCPAIAHILKAIDK